MRHSCYSHISKYGELGAYLFSKTSGTPECAQMTKQVCLDNIDQENCDALCADLPSVAIHLCPFDKVKASPGNCIPKIRALNAKLSGLPDHTIDTNQKLSSNHTIDFTAGMLSIEQMKEQNYARQKANKPRSPAHLKDCVKTKTITMKSIKTGRQSDIMFCTTCSPNSPGIPAPIFRSWPDKEVMWICHTADIIGKPCKGVLEHIHLDSNEHSGELWCNKTERLHTMRNELYAGLNHFLLPDSQLRSDTIKQTKHAFIVEYGDYFDGETIGAVSVSAWNSARCGLKTNGRAKSDASTEGKSMLIVQTGVRFQSCTEVFSNEETSSLAAIGASCVVQKKVKCSMREAPLSYEQCTSHVLSPSVKLFRKDKGQAWLGDPQDCTTDYLSYLTVL